MNFRLLFVLQHHTVMCTICCWSSLQILFQQWPLVVTKKTKHNFSCKRLSSEFSFSWRLQVFPFYKLTFTLWLKVRHPTFISDLSFSRKHLLDSSLILTDYQTVVFMILSDLFRNQSWTDFMNAKCSRDDFIWQTMVNWHMICYIIVTTIDDMANQFVRIVMWICSILLVMGVVEHFAPL